MNDTSEGAAVKIHLAGAGAQLVLLGAVADTADLLARQIHVVIAAERPQHCDYHGGTATEAGGRRDLRGDLNVQRFHGDCRRLCQCHDRRTRVIQNVTVV